jgi:hypothetical protein
MAGERARKAGGVQASELGGVGAGRVIRHGSSLLAAELINAMRKLQYSNASNGLHCV